MKKSLYMTTALAAAGVLAFGATDVIAAEKKAPKRPDPMSISGGGFYDVTFGISENSGSYESTNSGTSRTHYDAFDIKVNSEVYFKGNTTLDSGVKVDVTIQMETDEGSSTNVDHAYIALGLPKAGTIGLGAKGHGSPATTGAPSVGAVSPGPDVSYWISKPSANALHTGTTIGAGDKIKVTYSSEDYSGLTFGGSYTPNESVAGSGAMPLVGGTTGTNKQVYDAGVKYKTDMGTSTVTVDFGYWEQHGNAAGSFRAWRTGGSLVVGDVTVGASYKNVSDTDSANANTNDTKAYDVGIQYAAGDAKFSIKYANQVSPMTSTAGDDEVTQIALGTSYNIGNGVDFVASVVHADWDDESTAAANNNDGWAIVGGIQVDF
jgi:outer membrane protein OmpU